MRRAALLLIANFAATATFAGAYLESADTSPDSPKDNARVTKMWFDGGRMRTENGGKGEGAVAIFKNNAMYIIDPASKSYRILDKAALEQLSAQLAAARKKLEASMANMPPEKRQAMEKMLGKSGSAKPKRVLKNTGRTETVAGFKCTLWEATEDGKKDEELCVAAPGNVPGGDDMMTTLRSVGEMLKGFSDSFGGNQTDNTWRDLDTVKGVPVMMRQFEDGKVSLENRLAVARKESVNAAQFEVPAGYTEKKISMGPAGAQ